MKRKILLLLSPLLLSASLFDFMTLDKAQKSYAEGNYTQAVEAYDSLAEKSDEVLYDEANSYYKLREYEKAKSLYGSIKKESLLFNKWHNLGNCHAQMNKIDEGIKAYEEALKIREDADTRFNLELLKKKKKEQEKKKQDKKNDKNDQKKKDEKNNNDQKDDEKKSDKEQDKKDKDGQEKKSPEEKKKEEEQRRKAEEKKREEAKKDKNKGEQKQQQAQAPVKKEPISEKELRKYQKILDKRGINTLLVPLKTEGEHNNEFKPW